MGVNLVGKGLYFTPDWRVFYNDDPSIGALYPYLMPTVQKQFNLNDVFDINIGTQTGFNLSRRISNKELAFFNYAIGIFHFMDKKSRVVGGVYHTNRMFVGDGTNSGILLGYEVKINKRMYLMGDWVSGDKDASVIVIGGMYNLFK